MPCSCVCRVSPDLDWQEDPTIPEGMTQIELCPDIKELLKTKIMFKWDCGWHQGHVIKRINRGQYNYYVQYKEEEDSYSEYRQSLLARDYYSFETEAGHWFCITPTAPGV